VGDRLAGKFGGIAKRKIRAGSWSGKRVVVSIIFYAPCLFMHHLLCVLFTLHEIFTHFVELTY
jgi:hypothetical protein